MVFLFLFLMILAGSGALVFLGLLIPASHLWFWILPFHGALYAAALLCFFVVISARVAGRRRSETGLAYWSGTYFFSFLGLHSLFFAAMLVSSFFLFWPGGKLEQSALLAIGGAYGFALLGLIVSYKGPKLTKVNLGKNSAQIFTILQISDLHIGATVGASYVKKLVSKVLASRPDCIVLTGDIGDGDPQRHQAAITELAKLKAPYGVFLVLGNHEFFWPTEQWVVAFQSCGIRVLVDETCEVLFGSTVINLIGLSPVTNTKIQSIAGPVKPNTVVLAHYPSRAKEAASFGAKLFLAGHTHGGQFWPWSWMIYLFHRYAKGLYRLENTDIYVSCGSGHWGPPFRFGQRSEITWIELGV